MELTFQNGRRVGVILFEVEYLLFSGLIQPLGDGMTIGVDIEAGTIFNMEISREPVPEPAEKRRFLQVFLIFINKARDVRCTA